MLAWYSIGKGSRAALALAACLAAAVPGAAAGGSADAGVLRETLKNGLRWSWCATRSHPWSPRR